MLGVILGIVTPLRLFRVPNTLDRIEIDLALTVWWAFATNKKEDDAAVSEYIVVAIQQRHRMIPLEDLSCHIGRTFGTAAVRHRLLVLKPLDQHGGVLEQTDVSGVIGKVVRNAD